MAGTVAADSFAPSAIAKSNALHVAVLQPISASPASKADTISITHAMLASAATVSAEPAMFATDSTCSGCAAKSSAPATAARIGSARASTNSTATAHAAYSTTAYAWKSHGAPPLVFHSSEYRNWTTGRYSPARPHSAGQYATRHAVSNPEGACNTGLSTMIGPSS